MRLALWLVPLACTERGLGDGDADGAIEHPPELLEQYELACKDWCALLDECGRDDIRCDCGDRDFSEKHDLCLEKAALRLECKAALACEEVERLDMGLVQDRPCFGEGIAEAGACNFD